MNNENMTKKEKLREELANTSYGRKIMRFTNEMKRDYKKKGLNLSQTKKMLKVSKVIRGKAK